MTTKYSVHMIQASDQIRGLFPSDYFPRKFAYKKEADDLCNLLIEKGCKAEVKVNRTSFNRSTRFGDKT